MGNQEIQAIDGRQWWPISYLDESMPAGRTTPSAWLWLREDGAWVYGERDSEDWTSHPVTEGTIIQFIFSDNLGRARMTAQDDGSVLWDPRPADDTYIADVDDYEMSGDGPDDFVRNLTSFHKLESGEEIEVFVTRQSYAVECRFTAMDGSPRFVAINGPIPEFGERMVPPPDPQAATPTLL